MVAQEFLVLLVQVQILVGLRTFYEITPWLMGAKKNPGGPGFRRGRLESGLSASEVFLILGADLDLLALLDKKRDVDREAVFASHGLLHIASRVAFDGRRGFEDFYDDRRRKVDGDGLFFDEENHVRGARDEEFLGVFEGGCRDVIFFVGVHVDEDVAAIGLVGELEGFDAVIKDFKADSDAATDRDLGAGFDGAEFHLDVRGVVWGGAHETLENDTELTIVAHDVLLLDAIDGYGCHGSKGEDKPSAQGRSSRTCPKGR